MADATLSTDLANLSIGSPTPSSPRVPVPGQRNILITSALPYVNNVPHLGNIVGCVLSADVYSRYCRLAGYNSVYICGTDEYGTATETRALEEGLTPQQICDKYHHLHKGIYDWFDIGFDYFGRTTTKHQTEIAQDIFLKLNKNGFLKPHVVQQLFSEPLQKFLADRFVIGTCPFCGYDDARGDQCDNCGKLLNTTELLNPKCKMTGTTPILKESKHLFLDLPQLTEPLQKYIEKSSSAGGWTSNSIFLTQAWLREGLKERCITRDLKWGTPVPLEEYADKVFYVWFDAPIGYISITANYTPEWEKWWKNPENVEHVEFMGKDNVPFHTVIFPASLIGTGDPWTMMNRISTTEYLNYEDGKFSKSRGVGVFGNSARDTNINSEVWRYYLISNRPEQQDSCFIWSDFAAKNNNELIATLGNLVQRALSFVFSRFNGVIPPLRINEDPELVTDADRAMMQSIDDLGREYVALMEEIKIKEALRVAMGAARVANKFLQDNKPWDLMKQPATVPRGEFVLSLSVHVIYWIAHLMEPFMPGFTRKVLASLNTTLLTPTPFVPRFAEADGLRCLVGHTINKPEVIFRMLDDKEVESLRQQYSGNQKEDEQNKAAAAAASTTARPGKGAAAEAAPKDAFFIDIRVGTVLSAQPHDQSDKYFVAQVDVGEEKPRQIIAGVAQVYSLDRFLTEGKRVLAVCNLKTASIQGSKSEGMLLASETKDATTIRLLSVSEEVPVGTRVIPVQANGTPEPPTFISGEIDKKQFDKAKLSTNDKGEFIFSRSGKNYSMKADTHTCQAVEPLANAKVR